MVVGIELAGILQGLVVAEEAADGHAMKTRHLLNVDVEIAY